MHAFKEFGTNAALAALLALPGIGAAYAGHLPHTLFQPTIAGITLGDAPAKVRSLLGEPTIAVNDDHIEYRYDGLLLYMDEGSVFQIFATNKSFCTPTGVCPGTSQIEVEKRLGKPLDSESVREGENSYLVDAAACWLKVEVHSGYVAELAILCQP